MNLISICFIALIICEHLYIMWMEMFAWTTVGRRTFKSFPSDLFDKTKSLAANQGLYNGFLAAGLAWSLCVSDPVWSTNVACFFLSCVTVAGIYGALTTQKTIFYIQALPAIVVLVFTILR